MKESDRKVSRQYLKLIYQELVDNKRNDPDMCIECRYVDMKLRFVIYLFYCW